MAHFEINLIRDRVLPKPLRKGLFWTILVYLVLCSVGFAFVVHRAAMRFVDASNQLREKGVIERQFKTDHRTEKSVLSYAQRLQQQIGDSADVLAGIEAGLQQHVGLSRILLGLAKPLPENCFLVDVTLTTKDGTAQFSVMTPADRSPTLTGGQIIAYWSKDGTLETQLKEIRAERSTRQHRAGKPVVVHRFSATLTSQPGGV
jgi:hypothetical protein